MSKNQFNHYLQDFLDYLEIERNRSLRTIRNYKFYLERFKNWLKENNKSLSLKSINLANLKSYRKWLNRLETHDDKKIKKNKQNYHLIALRSWLKYLIKQDIKVLSPEKIELAKMPDRQIDFLEVEEVEDLLNAPLKHKESEIIRLRDK